MQGIFMAPETLTIQPLTKAVFAPFGDVVETDPATMRLINGGTTERYHALAHPEALGEGAALIISLFRGQPRLFRAPHGLHPLGLVTPPPLLFARARLLRGPPGFLCPRRSVLPLGLLAPLALLLAGACLFRRTKRFLCPLLTLAPLELLAFASPLGLDVLLLESHALAPARFIMAPELGHIRNRDAGELNRL